MTALTTAHLKQRSRIHVCSKLTNIECRITGTLHNIINGRAWSTESMLVIEMSTRNAKHLQGVSWRLQSPFKILMLRSSLVQAPGNVIFSFRCLPVAVDAIFIWRGSEVTIPKINKLYKVKSSVQLWFNRKNNEIFIAMTNFWFQWSSAYEVFRPKGDTYYHPLEFWAQFLRLVLIYAVLKGKKFPRWRNQYSLNRRTHGSMENVL